MSSAEKGRLHDACSAPQAVREFEEKLLEVAESLPKRLKQCRIMWQPIPIASPSPLSLKWQRLQGCSIRIHALLPDHGFFGYSEMQRLFRENYVGGWPDYSTASTTCAKW